MERASGRESTSMETRSRLDSLSGVVFTARTSTTSLSQLSMRTVPFTLLRAKEPSLLNGYVCANSRVTPKESGAASEENSNSAKPEHRTAERDNIVPPSWQKIRYVPPGHEPTAGPLTNASRPPR